MFLYWLRWVLVLPAALIGSVLGQWIVTAISLNGFRITGIGRDSIITILYKEAISHGFWGYFFICAGTLTAPNYKKKTSVFLCGIGAAFAIIFFLTAQEIPLTWRLYFIAFFTIGCLSGAIHMHEKFPE